MHPACPSKKQNHLQNSLLRRTQFWIRKTFSKPASLKRASLVVYGCPQRHRPCLLGEPSAYHLRAYIEGARGIWQDPTSAYLHIIPVSSIPRGVSISLMELTFCTFSTSQLPISLANVLRATMACAFSSLIWSGSAPAVQRDLLSSDSFSSLILRLFLITQSSVFQCCRGGQDLSKCCVPLSRRSDFTLSGKALRRNVVVLPARPSLFFRPTPSWLPSTCLRACCSWD